MRPSSTLGCLGTLVLTYLLLIIGLIYLGVAAGAMAVLATFFLVLGASANIVLRAISGIALTQGRERTASIGRVGLGIILSTPILLILLALPFSLAYSSSGNYWPLVGWGLALLVSTPAYYWVQFTDEIPLIHKKMHLPFPSEQAMRKEQKKLVAWIAKLFWVEESQSSEPGNLILGKGIQGESLAILPRAIVLDAKARSTHTYVIGQPGTGKSRALESWTMQDILSGQGVAIIDPHGDLFNHILSRIALLTRDDPNLAERIVILNPLDPIWTVGFNPLEAIKGFSTERLSAFLTDIVVKIWQIDSNTAPRMIRLVSHTFLALAELGVRLVDVPRFLLDEDWRESLLARVGRQEVINYFRLEFPESAGARQQWVNPVLNKLGSLLFDEDLRLIFAAETTINFGDILNKNLVLLVNLSKGLIGEGNSALLGAFIVAHIQKAALARSDEARRRPYYLYLDEFQNYTTDNIKDILSESRKYGLSLVLAHQHLSQLSKDFVGAVLNTTGTIACFRAGYQDASLLSREIFPLGLLESPRGTMKFKRFGRYAFLPFPTEEREPLGHEELATLLTQLDQREFWVRQRGPNLPAKHRTFDMRDVVMNESLHKARQQLINISGQRFGKLKKEVRKQITNGQEQYLGKSGFKRGSITDYEET